MKLIEDRRYYVYIYLDTRKQGEYHYMNLIFDYEPFYVGMGSNNRYRQHLSESYNFADENKHKCNIIRKIKKKTGKDPLIKKYEINLNKKEASELETWLISVIGRSDLKKGPLSNKNDGDNSKGFVFINEEHRNKMMVSKFGRVYYLFPPNGEMITTNKLSKVCRENNLNVGIFYNFFNGENKSTDKGWCGYIKGLEHLVLDGRHSVLNYVIYDYLGNIFYAQSMIEFCTRMNVKSNILYYKVDSNEWFLGFKAFTYSNKESFIDDWCQYKITDIITNKIYKINNLISFSDCYLGSVNTSGIYYSIKNKTLYKNRWIFEKT